MRQIFQSIAVLASVAACAPLVEGPPKPAAMIEPPAPQVATDRKPPATARTVDEFDTTTTAEKKAAQTRGDGTERRLGVTVASLGAPTETGFWLKTPLVSEPGRGRVENPATGKSAKVDLIPIAGPKTAGSRMSLAAMRLIGADLTGLPEVVVFLSPE